jgi:hypothetical protein
MRNKQMQDSWMQGKQAVARRSPVFPGPNGVNLIVCVEGTNDQPYGVVLDCEETHQLIRDLVEIVGLPTDIAEAVVR